MDAIAYRVEAGYEFPSEILTVTEGEQRWRHACCDIPHGFYGDRADPTILATRPIKVARVFRFFSPISRPTASAQACCSAVSAATARLPLAVRTSRF